MNADRMNKMTRRGATVIDWIIILTICVFSYLFIVNKVIVRESHPPGSSTRAEMSILAIEISALAVDCGVEKITPEVLPEALYTSPGWPNWHGPYPGHSKDEWGTDLRYKITGTKLRIESAGRDKIFDTKDDIAEEVDFSPAN